MTTSFTANELFDFLDWAMNKGLLKSETGKSRKIAAQKVLGALDESEREDLRTIDMAATFDRFVNKSGKGFTPQSLTTYRSRFQIALEDFLRYKENPAGFRFEGQRKQKQKQNNDGGEPALKSSTVKRLTRTRPSPPSPASPPAPASGASEVVFPIPIRDGVIVRVHNLPNNLTKAEAQRISAVVMALAMQ